MELDEARASDIHQESCGEAGGMQTLLDMFSQLPGVSTLMATTLLSYLGKQLLFQIRVCEEGVKQNTYS